MTPCRQWNRAEYSLTTKAAIWSKRPPPGSTCPRHARDRVACRPRREPPLSRAATFSCGRQAVDGRAPSRAPTFSCGRPAMMTFTDRQRRGQLAGRFAGYCCFRLPPSEQTAELARVSTKLNHDRCVWRVSRASRLVTADLDGVTHRQPQGATPAGIGGLRHRASWSRQPISGLPEIGKQRLPKSAIADLGWLTHLRIHSTRRLHCLFISSLCINDRTEFQITMLGLRRF